MHMYINCFLIILGRPVFFPICLMTQESIIIVYVHAKKRIRYQYCAQYNLLFHMADVDDQKKKKLPLNKAKSFRGFHFAR